MEDGKTQETGTRAAQGRTDSLFTFKTHPLKYIPYPEFLHDNHSISSFMPHFFPPIICIWYKHEIYCILDMKTSFSFSNFAIL